MKSHMVAIAVLAAGAVSAEEVLKCDRNARLAFVADIGADPASATYMYEIVRLKM